ncbi:HlyD family secretion protein [Thiorhodococcus minor]|uniref:HlyD family secretion protein n=1 Tax=Thiorhodococcus minor TaxID=57489 RepID=A0A6M0K8A3_9GAMM|nr:HlyD family secretion protein [Thiorhodococcus minor]NEV64927.1 HlyD family secretion protein [Thiorhodococcus minor]
MSKIPALLRYVLTGVVVLVAVLLVAWKYWDYVSNPWTRDGQVRANVIQVAPRVSAPIVALPIKDNQFVKAGDLLFEIDPRTYQAALDQAKANLDQARDRVKDLEAQVKSAEAALEQTESGIKQAEFAVTSAEATVVKTKADFERATSLVAKGDVAKRTYDEAVAANDVAQADLAKAQAQLTQANSAKLQSQAQLARARAELGALGEDNAQLRAAKAALETAQLDLEFTQVRASVDGYVTNLNLRLGSQAVANQPALALVDAASYWVHGYFRESLVGDMRAGDPAVITLMTYPDQPLQGQVDSISWGISQSDGSTGYDLLPSVSPTFQWIRLAQRIPVRVHLDEVPEGVALRVGTTASVLVMTGSGGDKKEVVPLVPAPLQ